MCKTAWEQIRPVPRLWSLVISVTFWTWENSSDQVRAAQRSFTAQLLGDPPGNVSGLVIILSDPILFQRTGDTAKIPTPHGKLLRLVRALFLLVPLCPSETLAIDF